MKICFKCGISKSLNSFYKHKGMSDGHLNKCTECTKLDVRQREELKSKDPAWIEKERARHREKYVRLNYKEKQKVWDAGKEWKSSSIYKGLSKYFNTPKGLELHHWNYDDSKLRNVFVMTREQHKKAHTFLTLDLDVKLFKTLDNEYLLTKKEHFNYLKSKGVEFISYQAIKNQ